MRVSIDDIRMILSEKDGWFEPDMESRQYILDIRLKNYPYIVIRFVSGIDKETEHCQEGKVFAINLMTKSGWIRSTPIHYYVNWKSYLLNICRSYWRQSMKRAKRQNLERMTVEEYERSIVV